MIKGKKAIPDGWIYIPRIKGLTKIEVDLWKHFVRQKRICR